MECIKKPGHPLAEGLCDAFITTASTFPPPRGNLAAEQRPDDKDRIMDRYTCLDEPPMRDLVSSSPSELQNLLKTELD
jgi:hypothetical protein